MPTKATVVRVAVKNDLTAADVKKLKSLKPTPTQIKATQIVINKGLTVKDIARIQSLTPTPKQKAAIVVQRNKGVTLSDVRALNRQNGEGLAEVAGAVSESAAKAISSVLDFTTGVLNNPTRVARVTARQGRREQNYQDRRARRM